MDFSAACVLSRAVVALSEEACQLRRRASAHRRVCDAALTVAPRAQVVQRTTLRQLMPNAAAVFKHLASSVQLREPAFRNVVVIYRRRGGPPDTGDHGPQRTLDPVRKAAALTLADSPRAHATRRALHQARSPVSGLLEAACRRPPASAPAPRLPRLGPQPRSSEGRASQRGGALAERPLREPARDALCAARGGSGWRGATSWPSVSTRSPWPTSRWSSRTSASTSSRCC